MLFLAWDTSISSSIPWSMPLISDSACAMEDAVFQGMSAKDTAKQAQIEWRMVAKLPRRKAKRISPIISSGWDFLEAICNDGTIAEGFLRGTGALFGPYGGGFLWEIRLGRVGYLLGSFSFGSWVGGRIGVQY